MDNINCKKYIFETQTEQRIEKKKFEEGNFGLVVGNCRYYLLLTAHTLVRAVANAFDMIGLAVFSIYQYDYQCSSNTGVDNYRFENTGIIPSIW